MSCVRKLLPCSHSGLLWLFGVRRFIGSCFFVLWCVLSLDGCNDAMVARAVCVVVRDRFPAPLPSTASQHRFPAPVVHVVWWHHFEQGADPLLELCGFSLCWELRLQRSRSDCFFQFDSGDACRDVCLPNLVDVPPKPSALFSTARNLSVFSVRSSKEGSEISGPLLKSRRFFSVLLVSFCCLEHMVAVRCTRPHIAF